MDLTPTESSDRHTLTDVLFFDLEEIQTESALIPPTAPPPTELTIPPPRPSLRPFHSRASRVHASTPELVLRRSMSRSSMARSPELSSVSLLTFATSDAQGLARKLENMLAMCGRSRHKTEIVVGCDGHDEAVLAVARAYEAQGVRVVSWRKQVGALATWAQVTHASRHDVVVFTDLHARMAPDTLDQLLAPMRDPNVGMTVPSYVPCIDEKQGVRARLDAATHGITAASYAGVAVRRRLLRRPAHDTIQPGLVTALQVLGAGHRVVSLPTVRVFHPETNTARASFARIAHRTHGQLQAALRQREELLAGRKGMFFAMLHDGLKYVPALAAWLGCMLGTLFAGFGWASVAIFAAGALCALRANRKLAGSMRASGLERVGGWLTAGAAQAYGVVRMRT